VIRAQLKSKDLGDMFSWYADYRSEVIDPVSCAIAEVLVLLTIIDASSPEFIMTYIET
jgi:hypothetical protein